MSEIVPAGITASVQAEGRMDNYTISIWYNKIYRPYVLAIGVQSVLLLDDSKCHKSNVLQELMDQDYAFRFMMSPRYKSILQSCDVGINKPLKDRVRKCCI